MRKSNIPILGHEEDQCGENRLLLSHSFCCEKACGGQQAREEGQSVLVLVCCVPVLSLPRSGCTVELRDVFGCVNVFTLYFGRKHEERRKSVRAALLKNRVKWVLRRLCRMSILLCWEVAEELTQMPCYTLLPVNPCPNRLSRCHCHNFIASFSKHLCRAR